MPTSRSACSWPPNAALVPVAPPRHGPSSAVTALVPFPARAPMLPAIVAAADHQAQARFLEFFAATIRNAHTRRAYARGTGDFLRWCSERGVVALGHIQPLHVAAWIEELGGAVSVPTVKARLAAVRHLFDWLVRGQVVPVNPGAGERRPKNVR